MSVDSDGVLQGTVLETDNPVVWQSKSGIQKQKFIGDMWGSPGSLWCQEVLLDPLPVGSHWPQTVRSRGEHWEMA